jgi:hypothetical protein
MQVLDLDAHLKSRENDLDKAITQADALRSELAKAHQGMLQSQREAVHG